MTQSPQPGEVLTLESVKLLKAGDVLRYGTDDPFRLERVEKGTAYGVGGWVQVLVKNCTFIGRPDPEGWIAWSGGENPVGEMAVEVRYRNGETETRDARRFGWTHWSKGSISGIGRYDILAFRLAAPSVERDLGSSPAATPTVQADGAVVDDGRLCPPCSRGEQICDCRDFDGPTTAAEPGTVGMEAEGRNEPKAPVTPIDYLVEALSPPEPNEAMQLAHSLRRDLASIQERP